MDRIAGYERVKKINTQGETLTFLKLMSRLSLTSSYPGFHTKEEKELFSGGEGYTEVKSEISLG